MHADGKRPRSTVRVVFAVICFVLAGLTGLLGLLSLVLNGMASFGIAPAYAIGQLIGILIIPGLFVLVGLLLMRRPKG